MSGLVLRGNVATSFVWKRGEDRGGNGVETGCVPGTHRAATSRIARYRAVPQLFSLHIYNSRLRRCEGLRIARYRAIMGVRYTAECRQAKMLFHSRAVVSGVDLRPRRAPRTALSARADRKLRFRPRRAHGNYVGVSSPVGGTLERVKRGPETTPHFLATVSCC